MDGPLKDALDGLARGPASSEADAPAASAADSVAEHPTVSLLRGRFGDAIQDHQIMAGDEHVVHVAADRNVEVLAWLKNEPGQEYALLLDVTAVDYGGGRPLEVVYQLWSIEQRRALRVKALLPLDALVIDSVCALWRTADWLEREVFDMFGIEFRGHPDLRRILMPDNYAEGYPLRKDFPMRGRFSRAEQTRRALAMEVEDHYTPDELAFRSRRAGDRDVHASGAAEDAGGAPAGPTPGGDAPEDAATDGVDE